LPACWFAGPYRHCRLRRPVSSLSSTSACSGAGLGWHGRRRIADSTVYLEGLATGGVGPLSCANSWAVTVIVWRGSPASPVSGHRTERGLSVGPEPLWMHSRPSWRPPRAGLIGARSCTILVRAGSRVGRAAVKLLLNLPVACSPLNRPVACSPLNRPVACSTSQWPAHHLQAAPAPGPFPDTTDPDAAGPEAGRSRDSGRRT
jgi:hypothetical protein